KLSMLVTAFMISMPSINASGVVKYQGKELVNKKDVDARMKELKIDSMQGEQVYMQVLIQLAGEKLMAKQISDSKMKSDPEFQRMAKASAEEFERQYFMQKEAKKRITSQMRQSIYDQIKASMQGKKEIKPRILVVEDEKIATEISACLKKGENFEALVKKYSIDPSKDNTQGAGLLDRFIPEEGFSVEDQKELSNLKEDVVSKPIKSMYQNKLVYTFFLIEKGNRRDFQLPSIDTPEVAGHIEQIIMRQMVGVVEADLMRQLEVYDLKGNKFPLVPEQTDPQGGIPLIGGGVKK
ncbi:MAG: peptidylprolyl isomerase, partial [Alphaproteobacteria bacterium]|nr:peptidylprolyl isomerase [Alphaproteobacteria bacterium]